MKLYTLFLAGCFICIATQSVVFGFPSEPIDRGGLFDSLNVSLASTWPFSRATNVATDSVRKLAFVGCGGGVCVIDVSDSANPRIISDRIRTRDIIRRCFYSYTDQRLYVAANYDGIQAWDVADEYNPQKIFSYDTRNQAIDVFVNNNYAYVACWDSGFSIIDISNPQSPYEIGHLSAITLTYAVRVIGDYAYVGESFGGVFRVINISDPGSPYEVGYCLTNTLMIRDLEIFGSYAFLAAASAFIVIDIGDSANPVIVDSLPAILMTLGIAISNDGTHAYTAERDAGLRVVNISDPTNIYQEGFCQIGFTLDVSSYGNIVVCAGDVFEVVDVSNPYDPYLISLNEHPPGDHQAISAQGHYLYIGTQGSLRILDINDITNPTEVGIYFLPQRNTDLRGLDVIGNYAFIGRKDSVFQILDITDPTNPQPFSSCYLSPNIRDIDVEGNYAYVTSAKFHIVDISNLSAPTLVSTWVPGSPVWLNGIKVVGNYAYIANDLEGLTILDVSDPSNPSLVSQLNPPGGFSENLDIFGDYCYVAEGEGGVAIINIADPTSPVLESMFDTDDAYDVVYWYGYIYIADAFGGVKIADVTDPTNPIEIGYYDSPLDNIEIACRVCTNDTYPEYFFTVYYQKGLHIYKNLLYAVEEQKRAMDINQRDMITVFPNPARQRIVFNIGLVKNAEFLEIFDSAGRLVRRLTIPGNQTQNGIIAWNGKDEKGNRVQSGVYFGKSGSCTVKFVFIR